MSENYEWYSSESDFQKLTQGDILKEFIMFTVDYDEANEDNDFLEFGTIVSDVIVVTQACDLEQRKIDRVTFCPIVPIKQFLTNFIVEKEMFKFIEDAKATDRRLTDEEIQERRSFEEQESLKKTGIKKDLLKKLMQGSMLNFYMLNKDSDFDYHVVLLRDSFSLPIDSVWRNLEKKKYDYFKRLNPPYREHLSQAYANSFSRIGLPLNIDEGQALRDIIETK